MKIQPNIITRSGIEQLLNVFTPTPQNQSPSKLDSMAVDHFAFKNPTHPQVDLKEEDFDPIVFASIKNRALVEKHLQAIQNAHVLKIETIEKELIELFLKGKALKGKTPGTYLITHYPETNTKTDKKGFVIKYQFSKETYLQNNRKTVRHRTLTRTIKEYKHTPGKEKPDLLCKEITTLDYHHYTGIPKVVPTISIDRQFFDGESHQLRGVKSVQFQPGENLGDFYDSHVDNHVDPLKAIRPDDPLIHVGWSFKPASEVFKRVGNLREPLPGLPNFLSALF
jgi:hypothetical protein